MNFNSFQQYIARILLISLFLQSCGDLENTIIPIKKEPVTSIQTHAQATLLPTHMESLVDQQLTAQGGHAVSFYEEAGELKANVAVNALQGFSKTYEQLPVYIEQEAELATLPSLGKKAQERRIQLQPAHAGKPAKVVIYKGAGLAGGSNNKGKEKLQDDEEAEAEEEQENDLDRYQRLLSLATEGEAEAQFMLGQRAYELWKKGGKKEESYNEAIHWLERATNQEHEAAVALLNELRPPMEEEFSGKQAKRKFNEIAKEQKRLEGKKQKISEVTDKQLDTEELETNMAMGSSRPKMHRDTHRLILSLDGGGIRGLLEAYALNYIEKSLAARILDHFADPNAPAPPIRLGECFDLIAGTSTGGIISLAMRVINPATNRPCYDMETITGIYKDKGNQIFYGNNALWKLLWQATSNIYNPKPLENILTDYFGKTTLKDLNTPTLVTSYDTKKQTIYFFNSHEAKNDRVHDFTLKDVARSTSAAPTYFSPANIKSVSGEQYCFVDGGVVANNPVLHAYIYAKDRLYQSHHFHVISLGTGTAEMPSLESKAKKGGVRLLPDLIGVGMNGNSRAVESYIQSFINERRGDTYTRLDFEVDHQTVKALDNARANNLEKLVRSAEDTIQKEKDGILKTILDKLEKYYAQREYYVFHKLVKEVHNQLQNGECKVDLSSAYLQQLSMPYVCERATWELVHALTSPTISRLHLTYLDLSGNTLASQGNSLKYLKELRGLAYLVLNNTGLTIEGLEKLKEINLCLDILQGQNNSSLHDIQANRIANALENHKISQFDRYVMRNLESYYKNQGMESKATIMGSMSNDSQVTGSAEWHLGMMYENGWELNKSFATALTWYQKAANQGHTNTQCMLGRIYENGSGVCKNQAEAAKWYKKAADQGSLIAQNSLFLMYQRDANQSIPEAQYELGRMYEKGWGSNKNYNEAARWYREAADQGYAYAQANLGWMYLVGWGVEKNYFEAFQWYKRAADQGDANAQYNVGNMCENGQGVKINYTNAREWYTKAAEQGHIDAQYRLAVTYYRGEAVEQNYTNAREWYTKSANQGHTKAQYRLGEMYLNGWEIDKEDKEAFKWYQKAADQGDIESQYKLGRMYENGWGVKKNYPKAVEWYEKSANQGYTYAQANLGWMYLNGWGVEKDGKKAVESYERAAAQRNAEAQYKLGHMYERGWGVKKDYLKAAEWYGKAANQGCAYAQANLGWMYLNGWGVKKDYLKAVEWYEKAASQGDIEAQKLLEKLSKS
ncbi:MAG: patatin-like phospholipase family protein [Candidatus Amoebophilus sp.]